MKLLLIHQVFVLPDAAGGTRHYEFARHLVADGHAVTVITSKVNYLSGQKVFNDKGFVVRREREGIEVLYAYAMPVLHRSFVWRVVSFFSFMLSSFLASFCTKRPDIVMGTSPNMFQALSAWAVAFLRRRPFLLEVRDLWPEFGIDIGVLKNPILIWLSRRLELFLYNRARHIIVNSPAYRDYLIEKGVPANKITLIPNGVDPTMFEPEADGTAVREQFRLHHKFVVTYTGALGIANDISTILRAAQRLNENPDVHFLLVGDGKERANLEATAAEMGLTNVTFAGAYPKSRIPAFLAASDACTATLKDIPMFRTTYPNKVFDYMAAGRPTILGIDGVIREVVETAGGGVFVPPGDDAALAAAVRSLKDNPARSRAMGQAARAYVVEHFHRKHHATQFLELLIDVTRQD